MKLHHIILMLVGLILVLAFVFTLYVSSGRETIQVEPAVQYTAEEIKEHKDIIPEETVEVPKVEETEKEVEVMHEVTIEIRDLRFYPSEVTISPGTTVVWINHDTSPHKVVAYDRLFYGPRMEPGDEYSFTFTKAGTHKYFDGVFTKVGRGTIIVQDEPLPITGAAIGVPKNVDPIFGLLVVMFITMISALSHGIHLHYKR
jgi:plastocyanin